MAKILMLLVSLTMAGKLQLSAESEKYKNLFGDRFRAINSKPKLSDDEGLLQIFWKLIQSTDFELSGESSGDEGYSDPTTLVVPELHFQPDLNVTKSHKTSNVISPITSATTTTLEVITTEKVATRKIWHGGLFGSSGAIKSALCSLLFITVIWLLLMSKLVKSLSMYVIRSIRRALCK